jgi:PAS domain S-box-containing protein
MPGTDEPRKSKGQAAENELKGSEKIFRTILENAPIGIYYNDFNGRFLYGNRKAEEIVGYKRRDLIGKSFLKLKLLGPKDILRAARLLATNRMGKPTGPDVLTLNRKDGSKGVIEITTTVISIGGKRVVLGMVRDITEQKMVEDELRESEERYRMQFEEALDAIFIADAKTGIITDCNRAATNLLERDKSEIVGQHQRMLHPPEKTRGEFSKTFKKHLEESEGRTLETQVITKSGKLKDVAIKANMIELRDKKFLQGIFRDITEQKKMEEAAKKRAEELEKFSRISIGRELKMVALKKRVKELEEKT